MPDQPDIYLIMTDQQKASATAHHGNALVRTPTWTRLAEQGVAFDHCYAQNPICTPSRTSIMTGTYPLVHRVFCHQNHAPRNLTQLPELLQRAGYYTLVLGHYEAGRSLTRGWDEAIDMTGAPELENALKTFYGCGSRTVGWSSGEQPVPGERAHAAKLTGETERALSRAPKDKPLFMHVAYIEPHAPYFPPAGYLDKQRLDDIPVPAFGDLDRRPAWHREALANFHYDEATDEDVRRLVAAYYGLIEYADDQINRLLGILEGQGRLDNAWIILTSDHGDYTGEKGFFCKTETPYECLLHVPLVIRAPGGKWHAGERANELVELLDLFPTILNLAGAEDSPQTQGHDLVGWIDQPNREPLRDATFSAVGEYHGYLGTTMPWGIAEAGRHPGLVRGARDHDYSYIRDPDYGDEAYDLHNDPNELCNLLRDGAPPQGVSRLQQRMDVWEDECNQLHDRLGVIEGDRNFDDKPRKDLVGQHDGVK